MENNIQLIGNNSKDGKPKVAQIIKRSFYSGRVVSFYEKGIFDPKENEHGNLICLNCGAILSDRRMRTYCSDKCRSEYSAKHYWDWHRVKQTVFDRDNWNCRSCGCKVQNEYFYNGSQTELPNGNYRNNFRDDIAECDHIIPLHAGGKDWHEDLPKLRNFQTLCRKCHKVKSAKENKDRGKVRRAKRGINDPHIAKGNQSSLVLCLQKQKIPYNAVNWA